MKTPQTETQLFVDQHVTCTQITHAGLCFMLGSLLFQASLDDHIAKALKTAYDLAASDEAAAEYVIQEGGAE